MTLLAVHVKQRPIFADLGELEYAAVVQGGLGSEEVVAVGVVKLHEEINLLQEFLWA